MRVGLIHPIKGNSIDRTISKRITSELNRVAKLRRLELSGTKLLNDLNAPNDIVVERLQIFGWHPPLGMV